MRAMAVAAVLGALLVASPPAAAQEPDRCPAPRVLQFVPPNGFNTGREAPVMIEVADADRVDVAWGDGATQVSEVRSSRSFARLRHRYRARGRRTIAITARGTCRTADGTVTERASAPTLIRVLVRRSCARRRRSAIFLADCFDARGRLRLEARGLSTRATWTTGGCGPAALGTAVVLDPDASPIRYPASACEEVAGPPSVAGRLPLAPGGRILLRFAAPARHVTVRFRASRLPLVARPLGRSHRRWAVRLPQVLPRVRRITVRARRGHGSDAWVAGVR